MDIKSYLNIDTIYEAAVEVCPSIHATLEVFTVGALGITGVYTATRYSERKQIAIFR